MRREDWRHTGRFGELGKIMDTTEAPTRKEEVALLRRIKKGDNEALEALVKGHLRFAAGEAIRRARADTRLDLEDLMQEAAIGLAVAAPKFDLKKKVRFLTFAKHWVRARLTAYTHNHRNTIRVPGHTKLTISKVLRALATGGGVRLQDTTALAAATGCSAGEIECATHAIAIRTESLDAAWRERGDRTSHRSHADFIACDHPSPDNLSDVVNFEEAVNDLVKGFRPPNGYTTPTENYITALRMYFGLDGNGGATLDDIGSHLGVTRERARQLKQTALDKLARDPRAQRLFAEMEGAV